MVAAQEPRSGTVRDDVLTACAITQHR